jgi:hypothetical protein
VLLGDPQGATTWAVGEALHVDLRINARTGTVRPLSHSLPCEVPGQRNFAVNFETLAGTGALSDLQVTVHPGHRVRGALLYQRRLGLLEDPAVASPAPARILPLTPGEVQEEPSDRRGSGLPRIRLRNPR